MKRPGQPTIRRKLIRIIVGVTAAVLLPGSVFLVVLDYVHRRKTTADSIAVLADAVAFNSSAALAFDDSEDAARILNAFRADPNIRAAVLYNDAGEIFAEYGEGEEAVQPLPDLPLEQPVIQYGTLYYLTPVGEQDTRLGLLLIRYNLGGLRQHLATDLMVILGMATVALFCAYLLAVYFQKRISGPIRALEAVARRVSDRHDYSLRAEKMTEDEVGTLTEAFNEMLDQIGRAEAEIHKLNRNLEQRVTERTAELERAVSEIESFSYSVSHDLRAPLRSIDGFSRALLEDCADQLDASGKDFLQRIVASCQRMSQLIDDLLELSRITRREMKKEPVDLSALAQEIMAAVRASDPDRAAEVTIAENMIAKGDPNLLAIALDNLLRNAWKFTSKKELTRIEVGSRQEEGRCVFFVRDNGAGFDMAFAEQLFGVFQRLHSRGEFEGTGVGLATVRRIIERHGGEVWATGGLDRGATFYFTLPSIESREPGK